MANCKYLCFYILIILLANDSSIGRGVNRRAGKSKDLELETEKSTEKVIDPNLYKSTSDTLGPPMQHISREQLQNESHSSRKDNKIVNLAIEKGIEKQRSNDPESCYAQEENDEDEPINRFSQIKSTRLYPHPQISAKTPYTPRSLKNIEAENMDSLNLQRIQLPSDDSAMWTCLPRSRLGVNSIRIDKCSDPISHLLISDKNTQENQTLMWRDYCTYYNASRIAICSGAQLKEVPMLAPIVEEVDVLIFDQTKIPKLDTAIATENLPRTKTLAFINGALFRISPGFLQAVITEHLVLENNSITDWSFSWFEGRNYSSISEINLRKNLLQFLVSLKVRVKDRN